LAAFASRENHCAEMLQRAAAESTSSLTTFRNIHYPLRMINLKLALEDEQCLGFVAVLQSLSRICFPLTIATA
jgi:hypothetical protein